MQRGLVFINRCGHWGLSLATLVSALLLCSVIAACVWFLGRGGNDLSITDRLHVHFHSDEQSRIATAIVCNSYREIAWQYAKVLKSGRKPSGGTTYQWHGFRHWRVSYDGTRTFWVTAFSLWYAMALSSILPIIWIGRRLWARRFRFSMRTLLVFMVVVSLSCGAWSLTASIGAQDVTECLADLLSVEGRSPRVYRDPMANIDRASGDPRQCHYVGNAASPCPLIVTVDYGYIVHHRVSDGRLGYPEDESYHGQSGRACFFWFLGYKHELEHWSMPRGWVRGGS